MFLVIDKVDINTGNFDMMLITNHSDSYRQFYITVVRLIFEEYCVALYMPSVAIVVICYPCFLAQNNLPTCCFLNIVMPE